MKITICVDNGGLKQNRKLSGMSQKELADRTGLKISMIQQYEQGIRNLNGAKLGTLLKLCNALGCPLSALITDPETLSELKTYENNEEC